MFRCQPCGEVHAGSPETWLKSCRSVSYYQTWNHPPSKRPKKFTTTGWEIVETQQVCQDCYRTLKHKPPQWVNRTKQVEHVIDP